MSTLDDLRRVIRRIERAQPPSPAPEPLDALVGGEVEETSEGRIVVVRRAYAFTHRHGRCTLDAALTAPAELVRLLSRSGDAADPRTLLFVDTETTGLAGGTGTYAFLVGVGAVEDDRFVVTQYFMRDFDEEPALLTALTPALERAGGLVSFNGTGFDVPLLETRFVLARRRWPERPHVDLLGPARRVWGPQLDDCRLGTLEREVLGLVREGDVAGWEIPSRYFAYLRHRNPKPLAAVFAHNRDDVLSLVTLLGWFAEALCGDAFAGAPAELAGLGRLWERLDGERSLACYRAALAAGLDGDAAHRVRLRLAWWEKRRRRWDEACELWEAAARSAVFDPRPWEELAKFHEHRRRDAATALGIVTAALDLAHAARVAPRVLEAFSYRLSRLERRLGAARPDLSSPA